MDINQSPAQAQPTGSIYAALRLGNDAQPDVEETKVEALIDMRIMHLCIPEPIAALLQLSQKKPRDVITADGKSHVVPYVSPVRISQLGRECVTGALVFGNQVLLGAIPMEDMDLVVHPARQVVTVNPLSPNIPMSLAK